MTDRMEKLVKQFGELPNEQLGQYYATLLRASEIHEQEMDAIKAVMEERFPHEATTETIMTPSGTFMRMVSNSWSVNADTIGELRSALDKMFPVYVDEKRTYAVVEDRIERLRELLGAEYDTLIRESVDYGLTAKFRSAVNKNESIATSLGSLVVVKQSTRLTFESVPVNVAEAAPASP